MNRAAGKMLGYELGEARGKNIHELHHSGSNGSTSPARTCPVHGTFDSTVPFDWREDWFSRADGSAFPVELCSFPVFENGVYSGAVITFRDITERLQNERCFRMQYAISRHLDGSASIEQTLARILQSICEELGLDCGTLWQMDRESGLLEFTNSWAAAAPEFSQFLNATRRFRFGMNQGLPGRVWESLKTEWIGNLANEPGFERRGIAAEAGLRSGFALPIRLGDHLHGVMEFFSRELVSLDGNLAVVLAMMGGSIGQFIERKLAETEQARLGAILNSSGDFIGFVADEDGTILSVNRAVQGILGYDPAEVPGSPLNSLIPGYRGYMRDAGWGDDTAEGASRSARFRVMGLRKNGQRVPLEASVGECLENGKRLLTGIIADITERRAAEEMVEQQAEDLRRSEEALRGQTRVVQSIVASMGDGVVVADENNQLLLVNPAASAMLLSFEQDHDVPADVTLLHKHVTACLPDGRTPYPPEQMPLSLAICGESVDGAEIFVRSPERPGGFWLSETARPLIDEDGILRGGVVILRDVTEQRLSRESLRQAKEEAESANQAKSEFLSRMSHELRTPMNAILGFAQLLELDPLSPEQHDSTDRILKAGRHLLGLINEVLDISRIEAGRLNVEMEAVQPSEIVQAAIELVQPLLAQRNITLICPQDLDPSLWIHADKQRLTQVFINLLANAVKYNRDAGSVSVSFEETVAGALRMKVTDTGPGIAPEDLKKLFVPFERLGADRTAVEGTGLGLALVHRLVQLMGGTVGVESELGRGTTFWVEMRKERRASTADSRPAASGVSTDASPDSERLGTILYIEDNLSNLKLVEAILARLPGMALISAVRGDLGLEMARARRPDLILLDLQLPDMHGSEVLRALREDNRTQGIPVVVVSADATARSRQELMAAGARVYLSKPINIQEFLDVITGFF